MQNRKFYKILSWLLSIVVLIGIFLSLRIYRDNLFCNNFDILINSSNSVPFITKKMIESSLHENELFSDSIKIKDVDFDEFEDIIKSNPFVENVNFSFSFDRNLQIKISEKEPVLYIYDTKGTGYYLCKDRTLVKNSSHGAAHVPVANGNIVISNNIVNKNKSVIELDTLSSDLKSLYDLSISIYNNVFLHAQIEQIYVKKNFEVELFPKLGNHIIEFGKIQNLKHKLENLELFYKEGVKQVGWNKYKSISLKFNNQVVCTKN